MIGWLILSILCGVLWRLKRSVNQQRVPVKVRSSAEYYQHRWRRPRP